MVFFRYKFYSLPSTRWWFHKVCLGVVTSTAFSGSFALTFSMHSWLITTLKATLTVRTILCLLLQQKNISIAPGIHPRVSTITPLFPVPGGGLPPPGGGRPPPGCGLPPPGGGLPPPGGGLPPPGGGLPPPGAGLPPD